MEFIETDSFVSTPPAQLPHELRVVSWNIARGSKIDAILAFLRSAHADLIFLQETDKNARRTNFRNIAREIAHALEMNYVFGTEFEELAQGSRASPAYHGQATLSCSPLTRSSILQFRSQSSFWHPRWFIPSIGLLQRRLGGRMGLVTDVPLCGMQVVTYNLHLESKGGDALRHLQLQEFLEDASQFSSEVPIIAAGDFNFDISQGIAASTVSRAQFLNPFNSRSAPTVTTSRHFASGRAIDWILTRGPFLVRDQKVHTSVDASDHFPLSLTLAFS